MGKKHKKMTEDTVSPEETQSGGSAEKENFYVFDSSLKNIFQSGSSATFSISGTFDSKKDDGLQDEEKTAKEYDRPKSSAHGVQHKPKEPVRKVHTWKEHFFFLPNDPRFSEGLAFFSSAEKHGSKAFSDLRKNLKVLVRHKISKNKSLKIKRKFGRKKWKQNKNFKGK